MIQNNEKPVIILLAEDDPGDQELTRRALNEGKIANDLHIVNNGEQALDYLYRRGKYKDPSSSPRPSLILLDLNMPKIDGRQVLSEIKSDPDLSIIPVIALTTSRQEEDILKSYQHGVNSYITKPVSIDEFIAVIMSLEDYWFRIVRIPKEE